MKQGNLVTAVNLTALLGMALELTVQLFTGMWQFDSTNQISFSLASFPGPTQLFTLLAVPMQATESSLGPGNEATFPRN